MILGVMTLKQWVDAHQLRNSQTQIKIEPALEMLRATQIHMLLLSDDPELDTQFSNLLGNSEAITTIKVEGTYVDAIHQAHFGGLNPESAVSFIKSVQEIDEFPNLTYRNPGKTFQYYHRWIQAALPILPPKHTIVMFAGEFVRQDRTKMAPKLLDIASKQQPDVDISTLLNNVKTMLATEEAGPNGHIHRFKMGLLEEAIFDECMLSSIRAHTGLELNQAQFNELWQSTNPDFTQMVPYLQSINVTELRKAGFHFELICYTNLKDMRNLMTELDRHDQDYVVNKGQLVGFAGVPLTCSYVEQKSVKEMLESILKQSNPERLFLAMQSPLKSREYHVVYLVASSQTELSFLNSFTNLGLQALRGWDASPVHAWVNQTLAALEDANTITV